MSNGFEEIMEKENLKRKRCLKELGSRAIEDAAIKKAICDLAGVECNADICAIDFEATSRESSFETVEIKLKLIKITEPF
jgi:hypothetical protein